MQTKVSRTRGQCKARIELGLALMHLRTLVRLDEFPAYNESLDRCVNVLEALEGIREADRLQGLHRGSTPIRLAELPSDDLDDDLPPFPITTRAFPATSLRMAPAGLVNDDHNCELDTF